MDEEHKVEFTALAERARGLALSLACTWLAQELPGQVYWVDNSHSTGRQQIASSLGLQPLPLWWPKCLCRQQLYEVVPSVILTSATLSIGGRSGFRHFQHRLGLNDCSTLQLGSPFDYRRQVELHLFRQMPDPSADPGRYEAAALEKIPEYVDRTKGRAFVLFTSNQTMLRATDRLLVRVCQPGLSPAEPERWLAAQPDGGALPVGGQCGVVGRG